VALKERVHGMKIKYDPQAPILIIGAGRSGSTLLSAIFHNHSKISFFGESYFLAPFVWERIFNEYGLVMKYLSAWRNHKGLPDSEFRKDQRKRIGKCIAKFITDIMLIDNKASFWGYKEIWNGSPHFETFQWDIFRQIFPNAAYVHLVRNPIDFAISTAGRDGDRFTRKVLIGQLENWVSIHEHSLRCRQTQRYYLQKYEDLVHEPKKEMMKLLEWLNVPWDPQCLKAFQTRYVPSTRNPIEDYSIFKRPIRVHNLKKHMDTLGFRENSRGIEVEIVEY